MKKSYWLILCFCWFPTWLLAQQGHVQGKVLEKLSDGEFAPLVGASVCWMGTTVGTATSPDGQFKLQPIEGTEQLVVSFVGFKADTLTAQAGQTFEIVLMPNETLQEVTVEGKLAPTHLEHTATAQIIQVDDSELLKAACCNLSESFETIPSVDVSFTDAVTGTRQIQMLGLAGPYTQITQENIPSVRGLSSTYGLTYVPGTWVEGMQLIKGAGSVTNGFESIAGQINVELRKPETAETLYVNLYANEGSRMEANLNWANRLKGGKWSTATLLHAQYNPAQMDRNEDGFRDMPLSKNFIALHRWKWMGPQGWRVQLGAKGTFIDQLGGQMDFDRDTNPGELWGMDLQTQRLESWVKIGKVFEAMPWKTFGLQLSAINHEQDSRFGQRDYQATQQSAYANFLYQSILGNTMHKFKTGASFQYDRYDESLQSQSFDRTEWVPGAYFEYSYLPNEQFSLVAGLRGDYHNLFGGFLTPRMQVRYAFSDNSIARVSAGRGQRTANLLAEQQGLLASARQFTIQGDGSDKPYGLQPEVAWNMGGSFTQYFNLQGREGWATLDFYRTEFQNQVVVDLDQDPRAVYFYNLDGVSYSNSFQAQVDYNLAEGLDVRLAYRWFDVQTTYAEGQLQRPFVSEHRAFINLAYQTKNGWALDGTLNWQGAKRLPNTAAKPEPYQLATQSPDFFLLNAQVSKAWVGSRWEVYVGVENLLNFQQDNPILANEQPFGPDFDASIVWGPIFGRNTYAGLRYRIP